MTSGCVVRFFEPNDRIKKHLLHRIECEGKTLAESLAIAYHTVLQSPKTEFLSVEVEIVQAPAAVLVGG